MEPYKVEKDMCISSGLIGLNKNQSDPLAHQLKQVGPELFEVIGEIHFKKGDEIFLEKVGGAKNKRTPSKKKQGAFKGFLNVIQNTVGI